MKLYIQKLDPSATLPSYAYEGDAGMDIFSFQDVEIAPGGKALVSTGLKVAIPKNHAGFVWDKSGIAIKSYIKTMAGVIDSNYRGELKIALANLGSEPYIIKKGEKIAQLVVKPIVAPEVLEVDELPKNDERGEKGFGSSGLV